MNCRRRMRLLTDDEWLLNQTNNGMTLQRVYMSIEQGHKHKSFRYLYRRHAVSNCPYRWREIVLEKKKSTFTIPVIFFCLFLLSMYVIYRYFIVDMIDSVASEKNKTITIGAGVYIHTIYYAPWIGMCVMPLILSWRDIDSIPELYVWYAKGFPSSW